MNVDAPNNTSVNHTRLDPTHLNPTHLNPTYARLAGAPLPVPRPWRSPA